MCLRESQILMTTMLRDIDKICKKNNISYWIESGTLLGAVRHGGFIPWDDDIDIGMLRSDYNKFLKVSVEELPNDLFLRNFNTDKSMTCQWSKIVHKNSEFIEVSGTSGLFVDIFPYDFFDSEGKILKEKNKLAKLYEISMNSNRAFKNNFIKNIKPNIKILLCKILSFFYRDKDYHKFYEKAKNISTKSNVMNNEIICYGIEVSGFNNFFNINDIFPLKSIKFEDIDVLAPRNEKNCLIEYYGDNYMELPEEEMRVCHNKGIKILKNRD